MKEKLIKFSLYFNFFLFFLVLAFSFTGTIKVISIAGKYFSAPFYISIFSIPCFYISYFFVYRNKFLNKTIIYLSLVFSLLFTASLSMSYFLYPKYNGLFETSPLKVVIENGIKYLYDILLIPYFIFFVSFLNRKLIKKLIMVFLAFWIVFGLFQILVYYINNQTLWKIYDSIDFLKLLGGRSETFIRIRANYNSFRFYGISSEPASNCVLICVILMPFFISELKDCNLKITYRIFLIIALVFTLLFAYLTKSASVYSGMLVIIIYLAYKFLKNAKIRLFYKMLTISGVIFLIILIFTISSLRNAFLNKFIFKLFDTSDYSTQHRYSTIWNDIVIFITHPIFGVGDGNQGYYYASNLIGTWMSNNAETQMAIKGELGLLNGGAAIPSLISGFGIFGVAIIFVFYKKYIKHWKMRNITFKKIRVYYLLAGITFVILSTATQGIHRNYLLLLYIASIALFSFPVNSRNDIINALQSKDNFNEYDYIELSNQYYKVSI